MERSMNPRGRRRVCITENISVTGVVRAMKYREHMPPNVRVTTRRVRFADEVVMLIEKPKRENVIMGSPPPLINRMTIPLKSAKEIGIAMSDAYSRAGIFARTTVIAAILNAMKSGAAGLWDATQMMIAEKPMKSLSRVSTSRSAFVRAYTSRI
jgi:hypothetical protein